MPFTASDITKKNAAREVYMNKQMNYGSAGARTGAGVGYIATNTAASVVTAAATGTQYIQPAELSTIRGYYPR
jgi:hypothetical protein